MSSTIRKSAFLGMSHGSATHKLRKMILFDLLQKFNKDICFRCGLKIEHIDDLSIEHKEPWENVDVKLFWDLNNIAFSHLRCNRPHNYNGSGEHMRIESPSGMNWCSTCKSHKLIEQFSKKATIWNGLNQECRDCQKNYKVSIRSAVGNGAPLS